MALSNNLLFIPLERRYQMGKSGFLNYCLEWVILLILVTYVVVFAIPLYYIQRRNLVSEWTVRPSRPLSKKKVNWLKEGF